MTLMVTAVVGALLAVLLVIGAGPAFRSGAPLLVAFAALALGALAGALASVAGLAVLAVGLRRGQPVSVSAAAAIVIGLLAFGIPFQRVWSTRRLPAIHDISTDLSNPPLFQAVLPARAGAANGVEFNQETAARQRQAYPDIGPIVVSMAPGQTFDRAIDAARDMDWEVVSADRASGRLEATDTTRWFGFKDDIVVRLTPEGTNTKIDVRSLSRIGRGDLGTNARRIRDYLNRLR